ncbi:hypothetical protein O3P69_016595 [Scylla paramamosain]|uniref:Uncharacterized protein n=1 Tax=Scylla paramamosain TaxID=85552 RepID=A0AAW0SYQ9_SCYPA
MRFWLTSTDRWEILCLANTILITQTGLRLYCASDKKCDCLPASCCRNADHTLYRSYMTEFWQRFTLFSLMVGCWVMEVVSWMVGPADSELWALTDTLNTFQGVFIFITFLRSSKKRRLLQKALTKWSDGVAGGGGCEPNLSSSCFQTAVSPNRVLERLRHSSHSSHSSPVSAFVRWLSRVQGRRSRITTPQVLDNIIFRGKMGVYNEGFEEDGVEVEAESEAKRSVCGRDSVNKSFNPMWTAPHWRARWSRSYFPGAAQRSRDCAGEGSSHEGLPGVIKDSGSVSPASSIFYISSSSSSPSSPSPSSSSPSSPSPSFSSSSSPPLANWSFLRHKSGSLTLGAGQLRGRCSCGRGVSRPHQDRPGAALRREWKESKYTALMNMPDSQKFDISVQVQMFQTLHFSVNFEPSLPTDEEEKDKTALLNTRASEDGSLVGPSSPRSLTATRPASLTRSPSDPLLSS